MKKYFSFLLFVSLLGVAPNAYTDEKENPFREGTEHVVLSENDQKTLLAFIDTAKELLEKALREAKGKTLEEAGEIYRDSIKIVVLASYQRSPQAQLLMRIALNQALDLTYGVPKENGKGVIRKGVLQKISNPDLLTLILEDSIKLAIKYYQDDRQAVKTGSLISLPYMRFAYERFVYARLWMASITEEKYAYRGLRAILGHWHAVVTRSEQKHKALFAREILKIDEYLYPEESLSMRKPPLGERLRVARSKVSWLHKKLAEKWRAQGFFEKPEDLVVVFFEVADGVASEPLISDDDTYQRPKVWETNKDRLSFSASGYWLAQDMGDPQVSQKNRAGIKLSAKKSIREHLSRGEKGRSFRYRTWLEPKLDLNFIFSDKLHRADGRFQTAGWGAGWNREKFYALFLPLAIDLKGAVEKRFDDKYRWLAMRLGPRYVMGGTSDDAGEIFIAFTYAYAAGGGYIHNPDYTKIAGRGHMELDFAFKKNINNRSFAEKEPEIWGVISGNAYRQKFVAVDEEGEWDTVGSKVLLGLEIRHNGNVYMPYFEGGSVKLEDKYNDTEEMINEYMFGVKVEYGTSRFKK